MTLKGPNSEDTGHVATRNGVAICIAGEDYQRMGKDSKTNENRKFKVRPQLLTKLDALAERKATDVTELVNQAVRELLEREGFWPPKPEEKKESA
ncbi:MAG TPA: hypothetical protein VGE74_18400 [Gemmata sp.]